MTCMANEVNALKDLQQENATLLADKEQLAAKVDSLKLENEDLLKQIDGLRQQLFGKKSEKTMVLSGEGWRQLLLFEDELSKEAIEEVEGELAPKTEEEEKELVCFERKKRKKKGPKPLPDHLPREDRIIDLPKEEKFCPHGHSLTQVGQRIVEELEIIPAQMRVIRHIHLIYSAKDCACADCSGARRAEPEVPRLIEDGRAGPSLIAHVAVSKYGDHCPLYRQSQIFLRDGIDLSRANLSAWMVRGAEFLSPIVEEMRRGLLARSFLQADETPILVFKADKGNKNRRKKKAYLWGYGAPWAEVVFEFAMGRGGKYPREFLEDYEGVLQVDDYSGYNGVFAKGEVVRLACMAHIRRRFHEALNTSPKESKIILAAIQKLYRIERSMKQEKLTPAAKVERRRKEALPILDMIGKLLVVYSPKFRPQSPLGKAVSYAKKQWHDLKRYVDFGEAEIDNNSIEQTMRPVALGRKNYLFAGSEAGGKAGAIWYSLITTCKRLNINPRDYIQDVLSRVSIHPASKIAELTPRQWKKLREEQQVAATATQLV